MRVSLARTIMVCCSFLMGTVTPFINIVKSQGRPPGEKLDWNFPERSPESSAGFALWIALLELYIMPS